ncbi:2-methylaconitate cis-trans isomerase PrpF [Pantoea vagans]|uniref:2-methylaconitate cis-trans isomerase PrpF n=1 Tax=Pantoea vagans TaxID=470934 RepID=UPI00224FE98C|nr:2-methylaconitate cis-trans isomerase PrpF [Pantoea vagans]MCX3310995.1 2-methylaconitate cis-trans isomerase PrpF [Pantoea vagans]
MSQKKIRAVYMRGGTSKGLFFLREWLPADESKWEKLLLRIMGSPDPFEKQIDGLGGATSSTSKVVIISSSEREGCDVNYRFGQVSIDKASIDWSGNCGNLTSAVGPFALSQGLLECPKKGIVKVRIWQENISARIIAHVPVSDGEVLEEGGYFLDGVAFPGAEISLEYLNPCGDADNAAPKFPTGNVIDRFDIPGVGEVDMTLINAAIPTLFIGAHALGLKGTELQNDVNNDKELLEKAERIRAFGAVKMGLADTSAEATEKRPHTPKLTFLSQPLAYVSSGGKTIEADQIDINARIFSMGKLHHAMTGTGAIALSVAVGLPGTLAEKIVSNSRTPLLRIGHPSGRVEVGAVVERREHDWFVSRAIMSRSARRLMEGFVFFPNDFEQEKQ